MKWKMRVPLLIILACLAVPAIAESLCATTIELDDVFGEVSVEFSSPKTHGSLFAGSEQMNGIINIGNEDSHGRIDTTVDLFGGGASWFNYTQMQDLDYVPSSSDPVGYVCVFGSEEAELHLKDDGSCYIAELLRTKQRPFARASGETFYIEYNMTAGDEVGFSSRLFGSGEGVMDFIRGYGHGGVISYDWGSPGVVGMNVREYGNAKTWAWQAEGEGFFEVKAYAENWLNFNGAIIDGDAFGYMCVEFDGSFDFEPYIGGS